MRPMAWWWWVALIVGCKITEDEWPEKSAEAQCKFAERCSTSQFYYHFEDVKDCVADALDTWDDVKDYYDEECIYDDDAAKACLKALDRSCKKAGQEYEEVFEACFEVWDCDDDFTFTDGRPGPGQPLPGDPDA